MSEATTGAGRAEATRNEIVDSGKTESSGAVLRAWRAKQGHEGRKASRAASKATEASRLAICAATRMAVGAGAYETPPRAGSLGYRRVLEDLLNETAEGCELLAEAGRHTGFCMRRVPDRPLSVGCSCSAREVSPDEGE